MKEGTRIFTMLLLLLIFAGAGFVFGRRTARNGAETKVIVQVDTLIKLDTIVREKPILRYSYIYDTVRTYFTTIEHDTVAVDLPLERKVYAEDSLYRAVVSGFRPSLDSLTIYPKETVITITNTKFVEPRKWSVGIAAGPSVLATPSGKVYGGLGATVGLTYRF